MTEVITSKKRKLKPGMGKAKGGNFEGVIAKKLSLCLAPLSFIRVPSSGARLGGKNYELFGKMFGEDAMKIFVGDVTPTNEKECNVTFNFSIECKTYKASDSFETMVAGNANIFKWMNESIIDAAKINKIPVVIFKWNHTPQYIAILSTDCEKLGIKGELSLQQKDIKIEIFYLDELLKNTSIWSKPKS